MPLQLCFSWTLLYFSLYISSQFFDALIHLCHQTESVSRRSAVTCVPSNDGKMCPIRWYCMVWRYIWWGTIWGGTNTQSMVYDSWLPGIWLNHTLCWHGIVWYGAILRCLLWYYNLSWPSFSVWSAVKHCRLYGVWQSLKHLIVKYMVVCVCCVW